jgi:hypothetical protein
MYFGVLVSPTVSDFYKWLFHVISRSLSVSASKRSKLLFMLNIASQSQVSEAYLDDFKCFWVFPRLESYSEF